MVRGVISFCGSLGSTLVWFVHSFRFLVLLEIVGCGSWGQFDFWFAWKKSNVVRGVISFSGSLGNSRVRFVGSLRFLVRLERVGCGSWSHFVFWFAWK